MKMSGYGKKAPAIACTAVFLACVADIERRVIGAFGLIAILRQSFDISHRSDSKKGS